MTKRDHEHGSTAAIVRQDGATDAERNLKKLCDRTFLSLWSYPSLYRDQGQTATSREGKEVCDLLVVFERHIIIFSDKDCDFPRKGNPALEWSRWYRRAVQKSAEQVWGAERWIKSNPKRLFLDRSCSQPFPIDVPHLATAQFHRVVVAHDASRRCRETFGGTGSLILDPSIIGPAHYEGANVRPFHIGQIDPTRGFVHVFDDTTLNAVLRTLDTITDFVSYLSKKELLITTGRLQWAAGEDDLLAYYLGKLNHQGEHDFVLPRGADKLVVEEGRWDHFERSVERQTQRNADEVSYLWDHMIERFSGHILAGTSYKPVLPPYATISSQEEVLRFMARESRLRRRLLAEAVVGLIKKTETEEPKQSDDLVFRATRIVKPSRPGDPYYVFLLLREPHGVPYEEYRVVRRKLLEMLCLVTKLRFPDAQFIVGYATEPGQSAGTSDDALCIDVRDWTKEQEAEAAEIQRELGLLTQVNASSKRYHEYPATMGRTGSNQPRSMRNSPCPCHSGKKYKHCCLNRHRG